jgi:MATE family multidrug resistance protein
MVKRTLWLNLGWAASVGVAYILWPGWFFGLFANDPSQVALFEIGGTLLALSGAWQAFDAAGITLGEALRSAGDTTWTLWARLIMAWAFFVPAALISVRWLGGGYVGAMLCVIAYLALLAVVLIRRFRSGAWKRIDLTGVEPDLVP